MPLFGLDVSHHQPYLNYAASRNEGVEFVFLKATEGATFTDDKFVGNLANARNAGLLVAAYHYVKSNASAAAQVARVAAVVPKNVPVIPDVEANSGGVQLTRDVVQGLRIAGFTVPLLYLPRWYWQQIGSPSLAGLPPLWSSRYPDYTVRSLTDAYNKAPASYWSGYGGLDVALLQFTSSARVAGYSPLDANAYQGTRAQLAALLGGGDDDMSVEDVERMLFRGGPVTGAVAEDTVVARMRDLENMVWAGGPVLGAVADDSLIGRVRAYDSKFAGLATGQEQLLSKVDAIQLGAVDYELLADKVAERLAQRLAD